MRVCFDTDGTKTDFAKFVKKYGIPYFKKKYDMEVVNPDALEVEDVFDIKNVLMNQGKSEIEAIDLERKMLNKFWISHRFIIFSLLSRFRKDVAKTIRRLKKDGIQVDIDSSRAKTCKKDFIGFIARTFTLMQYVLNGVFIKRKNITFYENDKKKIAGIIEKAKTEEVILVDDKASVIEGVTKNNLTDDKRVKSICINECYNRSYSFDSKKVVRVNGFENGEVIEAVRKLIGSRKYDAIKRIYYSDKLYKPAIKVLSSIILKKYNPLVLGLENLDCVDGPAIYAPNHRSTLDPLVLTALFKNSIRWAALKRFFDGTDSIFNNSKNPILCKITSVAFKKMEFVPIERPRDNPNANNFNSTKNLDMFLKINISLGVFAEESTLKKEDEYKDFNSFNDTFIRLAKKNNSWIIPITLIWIKELKVKRKLLIKIGKPFKVCNMTIDDAMKHFLNIQKENLKELKKEIEKIKESKETSKILHYSK